ncbi:sensor histidine kinase [Inquilinus limosus]|uniref:histidine kinase n=1 Tax=Inquilinus limosus TaxID=171674 RepID=A0A211ZUE4_9PROT|nr:HAMP domain-containing sensor histidine kinase [Inquilinus limosus]OWJ68901.1 hypothetical protein BWR60_02100 [Inquilinus limosus]
MARRPSLTRRLVLRLSALQIVAVILAVIATFVLLAGKQDRESFGAVYVADILGKNVERAGDGGLSLSDSPAVQEIRRRIASGFWFRITDGTRTIAEGAGPTDILSVAEALQGGVNYSELNAPDGTFIGSLQAISTPDGLRLLVATGPIDMGLWAILVAAVDPDSAYFLYLGIALVIGTVIAVPLTVRSALKNLGHVANAAARIDPDRRGNRLPVEQVPREITPLVAAVNEALTRLDAGYERQRRFLASAAHELRTPIAILKLRLEAFGDEPIKASLGRDLLRLELMADQLLDLERLRSRTSLFSAVDLVALARKVAADLAPLAIANGYDLVVEAEEERVDVDGDNAALERATANLIHNAIQHGGQAGTIVVRVERGGSIVVQDEGSGIPREERERIFEPFHRLAGGAGSGLGLNLVSEIAQAHGGRAIVRDGPRGGASFHLELGRRGGAGLG